MILSLRARTRQARLTKQERAWSSPHAARPSSSGRRGPDAVPRTRLRGDHHRGNQRALRRAIQRPCTGSSPRSSGSSRPCSTPPSPVTTSRWRCRNGQTSPRCSPNPTRTSSWPGSPVSRRRSTRGPTTSTASSRARPVPIPRQPNFSARSDNSAIKVKAGSHAHLLAPTHSSPDCENATPRT